MGGWRASKSQEGRVGRGGWVGGWVVVRGGIPLGGPSGPGPSTYILIDFEIMGDGFHFLNVEKPRCS